VLTVRINSRLRAFAGLTMVALALSASLFAGDMATKPGRESYAQKIHIHGISDAGKLNSFLYRGNQPKMESLDELKELGIDTIVDLRGERRGLRKREQQRAEALGMQLVSIPGSGWSPPRDEQLVQFFELLRERPRRHVFVHCWLGGDRAGVFLATYRIAFEGWSPEQALHEMHMFHFHGFWHPAMTAYVKAFPNHLATSEALARFRSESR
jgi:protein tyrosine/serine phosphatase